MPTYAYIRVSTTDQNESRQFDAMSALGIPPERIFSDKRSGKDMARPGLQKMLSQVGPSDIVVVESVSRFARNTKDLLDLIDTLTAKGVEFVSQKEHIDTATPTGKFMLTIFGAVAELERGYIHERQREGIASAKARGVHLGRPAKRAPANFQEVIELWDSKIIPFDEALRRTGLKQSTFFNRLREHTSNKKIHSLLANVQVKFKPYKAPEGR